MRVVIQSSYRGGVCRFYFSREGNVYFNIREEGSVIQASLRGGECNLLNIIQFLHSISLFKFVKFETKTML